VPHNPTARTTTHIREEQPVGEAALVLLSLGAGIQSTSLALLAAEGALGRIDGMVFADTGWEPRAVYAHLERLEREVLKPVGIPLHRVSSGNIRNDALNPASRFATIPLYVKNPDGGNGMLRRQCTGQYKVKPIKEKVRELLGAPYPIRIPRGVYVEQWIGISLDEVHRAKDSDVAYMRNRHPLLEMRWTRDDCIDFLKSRGWGATPKSACLGCTYHSNAQWRALRDTSPDEWADVVAFDDAIRAGNARANAAGNPLLGEAFLHRSRVPLDQAPIDRLTHAEQAVLNTTAPLWSDAEGDDGFETGCSPWSCRADNADLEVIEPPVTQDDFDQAA
jgi:hypothetical protein